jgi:hypothetical protein
MFCVSDEVLNETVECTDGTVYLGWGLLKVRNIVEPEAKAVYALLAVTFISLSQARFYAQCHT